MQMLKALGLYVFVIAAVPGLGYEPITVNGAAYRISVFHCPNTIIYLLQPKNSLKNQIIKVSCEAKT